MMRSDGAGCLMKTSAQTTRRWTQRCISVSRRKVINSSPGSFFPLRDGGTWLVEWSHFPSLFQRNHLSYIAVAIHLLQTFTFYAIQLLRRSVIIPPDCRPPYRQSGSRTRRMYADVEGRRAGLLIVSIPPKFRPFRCHSRVRFFAGRDVPDSSSFRKAHAQTRTHQRARNAKLFSKQIHLLLSGR